MRCIADVNVLLPIVVGWHSHHAAAWAWWNTCRDASVILCWPVRLGVLRLLTSRVVMNERPLPPSQALRVWKELADDPRSLWLDSVPTEHEAHFVRLSSGRQASPNFWTDAWLAALGLALDAEMATFDNDFKGYPGLRLRLLSR